MLAAWQLAAEALAARQQQRQVATHYYALQLKQRVLVQWRGHAEESALERQLVAAADLQYKQHLLLNSWQGWSWYCW